MAFRNLDIHQLEVTSFTTGGTVSADNELEGDGVSFQRGCETWNFSCGGSCAYTCKGGFCPADQTLDANA